MEDNKKTNIFAMLGLIFSILFSGLILSTIGLIKAKKCHEGKIMSIIGIILSLLKIGLCIWFISIVFNEIENVPDIRATYCEGLEEIKNEACTLQSDGKYDCIIAICEFDTKKEINIEEIIEEEPIITGDEIIK